MQKGEYNVVSFVKGVENNIHLYFHNEMLEGYKRNS